MNVDLLDARLAVSCFWPHCWIVKKVQMAQLPWHVICAVYTRFRGRQSVIYHVLQQQPQAITLMMHLISSPRLLSVIACTTNRLSA